MPHLQAINLIYLAVVAQTTLAPYLGCLGGTPCFPAMALVLVSRLNCQPLGAAWAALAGVLCDALSDGQLGTMMIAFVVADAVLQALFADRNLLTIATQNRPALLLAICAGIVALFLGIAHLTIQSLPADVSNWRVEFPRIHSDNWQEGFQQCGLAAALTGGWMFLLVSATAAFQQSFRPGYGSHS